MSLKSTFTLFLLKLTKKVLHKQFEIDLHKIDEKEKLYTNTNTSTTIDIKRAIRSRDNFLFTSTILQEETFKEITNKKIKKSNKNSNKVQRKMHKILSKSKKHNEKI